MLKQAQSTMKASLKPSIAGHNNVFRRSPMVKRGNVIVMCGCKYVCMCMTQSEPDALWPNSWSHNFHSWFVWKVNCCSFSVACCPTASVPRLFVFFFDCGFSTLLITVLTSHRYWAHGELACAGFLTSKHTGGDLRWHVFSTHSLLSWNLNYSLSRLSYKKQIVSSVTCIFQTSISFSK